MKINPSHLKLPLTLVLALSLGSSANAATPAAPAAADQLTAQAHEEHGHHHGGHRGGGHRLIDAADVLGLSPAQLIDELKKGKSVAQIGKEKGIAEDQLVTRLLDKEKKRIQEQIHRVWSSDSKRQNA